MYSNYFEELEFRNFKIFAHQKSGCYFKGNNELFCVLFLSETLALLFVLPAVFGLISNVSNLCRRRPEDYDIHNSRKKPRIDYAPEFHQRPG